MASTLTERLLKLREGDDAAFDGVVATLYPELRQVAARIMGSTDSVTLQATAVLNEALLKLIDRPLDVNDRAHFVAICAKAMRQILIDHARARTTAKRGDGQRALSVDATDADGEVIDALKRDSAELAIERARAQELLDLDLALRKLAAVDARAAKCLELSFFGGMRYDELAQSLEISEATVDRDLRFGKAWLAMELGPERA
jgi:RNA polymerase sigma factor (TIGR02999 family)